MDKEISLGFSINPNAEKRGNFFLLPQNDINLWATL